MRIVLIIAVMMLAEGCCSCYPVRQYRHYYKKVGQKVLNRPPFKEQYVHDGKSI